MEGDIDITALDVRKLVASAFVHSHTQGLGYLHDAPGPLTDAEFESGREEYGDGVSYDYDYTRGRSMKLHLVGRDGKLFWHVGWYDHNDRQQIAVLVDAGMAEVDATAAVEGVKA